MKDYMKESSMGPYHNVNVDDDMNLVPRLVYILYIPYIRWVRLVSTFFGSPRIHNRCVSTTAGYRRNTVVTRVNPFDLIIV